MKVLIGCEESQAVCIEFRKLGHEAYSCDLLPCSGGHPEWHLQMDVFEAIKLTEGEMMICFPTCTYLTCSAEWAYKDGPYHQKIKQGTFVGHARREARLDAIKFALRLFKCSIKKAAMENPIGVLSTVFRKPDQVIHPFMFGDDASKGTCLWIKGLPLLQSTGYAEIKKYRCRCGNVFSHEYGKYGCCPDYAAKPIWGNQTNSGQNNLTPSADRAKLRSKTFPGIAKAMAEQWGKTNNNDK